LKNLYPYTGDLHPYTPMSFSFKGIGNHIPKITAKKVVNDAKVGDYNLTIDFAYEVL
jgi:hypothetical protein